MAIIKSNLQTSESSSRSQTQSTSSTSCNDVHLNTHIEYGEDSGQESDTSADSVITNAGTELCTVYGQTCSVPYELFDLPDLKEILSLDAWNNCLTEEDRYGLAAYLPDMDQQTFTLTLKQLLDSECLYFNSPLSELFNSLKGGLCPPKVVCYKEALHYLQKKEHYHHLRRYQNNMVKHFTEMQSLFSMCNPIATSEERLSLWDSLTNNCKSVQVGAHLPSLKPATEMVKKSKQSQNRKLVRSLKPCGPIDNISPPLYQENRFTIAKADGRGILKIKAPSKVPFPTETYNTSAEPREHQKIEKPIQRGVLKITSSHHRKKEQRQINSEVTPPMGLKSFKSNIRSPFHHQGMGLHECETYREKKSAQSKGKNKMNSLDIEDGRLSPQQNRFSYDPCVPSKYVGVQDRKGKELKRKLVSDMGLQLSPLHRQDGLIINKKSNGKKNVELFSNNRMTSQNVNVVPEDPSYAEQPWRNMDVRSRDYDRHSTDDQSDGMESPVENSKQYLSFDQPGAGKAFQETNLQRFKKQQRFAKKQSHITSRIPNEQRITDDEYGEEQGYFQDEVNILESRQHFGSSILPEYPRLVGKGRYLDESVKLEHIQSRATYPVPQGSGTMKDKRRKEPAKGVAAVQKQKQAFEIQKTPKITFKNLPNKAFKSFV